METHDRSAETFESGVNRAEHLTGESVRNLVRLSSSKPVSKGIQKAGRAAVRAVEKAAEGIGTALSSAGPMAFVVIILVLAIVILISVYPNNLFRTADSDLPTTDSDRSDVYSSSDGVLLDAAALVDRDAYEAAYARMVSLTEEAIQSSYETARAEAEKAADDWLKEHYPEDHSHISISIYMDSPHAIAETITPYILAVHGGIQYLSTSHGGIGDFLEPDDATAFTDPNAYQDGVREYAETSLFSSDGALFLTPVSEAKDEDGVGIHPEPYEEPVLDPLTGEQVREEDGRIRTETVQHETGTIYLAVNYDISGYRARDIADASEWLHEQEVFSEYSLEECSDMILDTILNLYEDRTGTRDLPAGRRYGAYLDQHYEDLLLKNISPGFSGGGLLAGFAENDPNAHTELWAAIRKDAAGHFALTGWGRWCTDFAHWMFWNWYGKDCGGGNGLEMAENTAAKYPDEFELSRYPAPGALFSAWGGYTTNHVGFVVRVEGDTIWTCDGNTSWGGSANGIRINRKWALAEFSSWYGGKYIFCNPKQ